MEGEREEGMQECERGGEKDDEKRRKQSKGKRRRQIYLASKKARIRIKTIHNLKISPSYLFFIFYPSPRCLPSSLHMAAIPKGDPLGFIG
jgi:hypothetical protein